MDKREEKKLSNEIKKYLVQEDTIEECREAAYRLTRSEEETEKIIKNSIKKSETTCFSFVESFNSIIKKYMSGDCANFGIGEARKLEKISIEDAEYLDPPETEEEYLQREAEQLEEEVNAQGEERITLYPDDSEELLDFYKK